MHGFLLRPEVSACFILAETYTPLLRPCQIGSNLEGFELLVEGADIGVQLLLSTCVVVLRFLQLDLASSQFIGRRHLCVQERLLASILRGLVRVRRLLPSGNSM